MTVDTPKRAWTDPRIDDLSKKVDDGFARVDARFEKLEKKYDGNVGELRGEMKAGFERADAKMEGLFERADAKMDAGFDKFDKKFDRLMWGLVAVGTGVIPALLGFIGSLLQGQLS